MRFITLFLLGILISIGISAQTDRRIIQFSGSISEKYPIRMTLTIQNNQVIGFYYYEKYKIKILLEGEMADNKLTLKESPDYESEFKVGFIGDFKDGKFTGIWTDKEKDKTLSFNAKVVTDTPMNLSKQISIMEGNYDNAENSDAYSGSLNLQYITDDLFCFEIFNVTETGCNGYLKGLISLTNLTNGIYTGEYCEEVKFSVSPNELNLTEKNCDIHGMNCPFAGKYRKVEKNEIIIKKP